MRIAALAHNLIGGGGLSVGQNIVALMPRLGPRHDYLIFVPEGLGYDAHAGNGRVSVVPVARMRARQRLLYELKTLPGQVADWHPDVVVALGNIGLLRPPCRQAVLIHQSQILYGAKHFGKARMAERLRFAAIKQWVRSSVDRTQLVFCQTPVTRQRFADVFHYPLDQIKLAPNAVSEFAKIDSDRIAVPDVLKAKGQFSMFLLAHYNTYKNLEVLPAIFRQFPDQLRDVRCLITIAAQQHKRAAALLGEIKRHGLEDRIVNVGPLRQEELAGYFCHCDALFFPTLLESFSGTYLEAMHFGLPILTSDLDFARYVCGDAALYFDPWNPADIVDKVVQLGSHAELRAGLIEKGSERIAGFFRSWQDIVASMLKDIEEACAR